MRCTTSSKRSAAQHQKGELPHPAGRVLMRVRRRLSFESRERQKRQPGEQGNDNDVGVPFSASSTNENAAEVGKAVRPGRANRGSRSISFWDIDGCNVFIVFFAAQTLRNQTQSKPALPGGPARRPEYTSFVQFLEPRSSNLPFTSTLSPKCAVLPWVCSSQLPFYPG
jgi:hypothetical protein